jgi:hypothetical protein
MQDDLFVLEEAPQPLRDAVQQLCEQAGRTAAELDGKPLGEVAALVKATYGDQLPDFWQVWFDWQQDDIQPMGDL